MTAGLVLVAAALSTAVVPDLGPLAPAARDADPMRFAAELQGVLGRADEAARRGDHAAAAALYRTAALAVPDRAAALSKLCESLEKAGDREGAIRACRAATEREGVVVGDYQRLAALLLARPGPLPPEARAELERIAAHLKAQPATAAAGTQLECALAARLQPPARKLPAGRLGVTAGVALAAAGGLLLMRRRYKK